jgi:hypothetical protein
MLFSDRRRTFALCPLSVLIVAFLLVLEAYAGGERPRPDECRRRITG